MTYVSRPSPSHAIAPPGCDLSAERPLISKAGPGRARNAPAFHSPLRAKVLPGPVYRDLVPHLSQHLGFRALGRSPSGPCPRRQANQCLGGSTAVLQPPQRMQTRWRREAGPHVGCHPFALTPEGAPSPPPAPRMASSSNPPAVRFSVARSPNLSFRRSPIRAFHLLGLTDPAGSQATMSRLQWHNFQTRKVVPRA